ncbi:MAG TPA: TRAM domain-containing protein [Acidimicrobiales bacterium]|nr:TRAM domain-containing protein [Acidimicrobiales bacterium]
MAGDTIEVRVDGIAGGGEGVGRDGGGRVVFVAGALPGERVRAEVVEERPRHARARLLDVVQASPDRRPPPCPHVADGCGGCDWQHVADGAQRALRREVVADALARIGGLADPVVTAGPALPAAAARTTVRAVVAGGRAGFRRRGSHHPIVVGSCLASHPAAEELLVEGRFGGADEVVVRVGARTGERMVLASPTAEGVAVPGDVLVVGADELAAGRRAWIHEEAAGRRWRVSARSFFQTSPEGADALVVAVGAAVGELAPRARSVVDLCAGVGLFAGTVAPDGAQVVAVEPSASAVADARHNLADRDVRLVRSRLDRWRPSRADVVVADPPRAGLGRAGVDRVVSTGADTVVLVSCDPGALGRDVGLLVAAGYRWEGSEALDLFPQTSHVEVVSRFRR